MAKIIAAVFFGVVGLAMIVIPLLVAAFMTLTGATQRVANNVMIAGGGIVAFAIWLALS